VSDVRKQQWLSSPLYLALILLLLALAGCASPSPASSHESPAIGVSQADRNALDFLARAPDWLERWSAAAAPFLSSVESGAWMRQSAVKRYDLASAASNAEGRIGQLLMGKPTVGTASIRVVADGAFMTATHKGYTYLVDVGRAATDMLMGTAAHTRAVLPGWARRLRAESQAYTAAIGRLRQAVHALEVKYGAAASS
jgi:hypothetical protein